MAELTVANYLAALQDDPWDQNAIQGLGEAIASGDPQRVGDDPVRLLEFARRHHEVRGESVAAAKLIEFEIGLVNGDPEFASVLYRELGRMRREDLMDDAGAREAYAKALELRPNEEDVERVLEQLEQIAAKWQELANHFVTQADEASDPTLKTSLLVRAASILWQYKKKGKNKDIDKLFKDALATDPASARAARLYEITLREREKWKELGEVLLSAAQNVVGRDDRLGLYLAAARVLAQRLEDNERAAQCYERVLELVPAHDEALGFLVAHFTEKKLWDHLVALYEDALRARQLKADAEQGILLQIAMVHWRMLERPERAEPYFARVRKADPSQPVMLEFYRELYGRSGETGKLLLVLSDAQRRVASETDKVRLSLEVARLAQSDPQASERAIDAFKLVLRHDPAHREALASLKQLYRRSGKWNALVELLRSESDGLPAGAKDEKLGILRELLGIYRDELKLEAMVLGTYQQILALDSGNREAGEELARTYEALGRWNDLIPVLVREADASDDPKRKVALYLRVAKLWIEHFSNYNQATAPLEQVLTVEPENREALSQLKEIYTKKRAWKQLFGVLSKEEELTQDPGERKALLSELASLAGERLHEYGDAIRIYKRLLELEPKNVRTLDALEKLTERAKDWDSLADVLEARVDSSDDVQNKIKLLSRLGTLHAERTSDPKRAAKAWRRVLELDPKNGRAMRTLRESYLAAGDFAAVETLYAEANDWEGFVDVLGTAADRTDDKDLKKQLSFRAAEVYEQKLKEVARAFRSYERVLAVDPENERAVRALLPIYEKDDKWPRVAQLLEVLLGKTTDTDERLLLHLRLSDVYAQKLRDGERAYGHAVFAYALSPEAEGVRPRLESTADLANAHERLARIYAARADTLKGDESVALRRRVAQIAAEKLKRPDDAATQLEKVIAERPDDAEAYDILERIYRQTARHGDLRTLLERKLARAEARLDGVASDDVRFTLIGELARVDEELLGDRLGAVSRYRQLHELRPGHKPTLATLDRLLTLTREHAALAGVLDQRIELAEEAKERSELRLRLGKLSESELGNLDRAIDAFSAVLHEEPGEPRAVEALERIAQQKPAEGARIGRVLEPVYERTLKLDKLSAVLRQRLEQSSDEVEKRALKLRIAELSGSLGDPKGAYTTLESAFLDNPGNPELWDRMTLMADQAGTHTDLAAAFTTAIEAADLSKEDVAELSARTARVYDQVLGQPEKAEPFHARVLANDPLDETAYEALRELYTNADRWDDLKALYRNRIANTVDLSAKLDLLLQVCFLYEEILDDVPMAIRSYQEVLELEPSHTTSRRALERLYTRAERFRDLVSLLEGDRNDAEGKEAIELTHRIGELYEHKLREAGLAVDQYAAVLEEQPTHLRAQEALERLMVEPTQRQRIAGLLEPLYTAQGAHAELARVLEVQLEELREAGARVGVLMRLGELYERELRDVEASFKAYARAVDADPSDPAPRQEYARIAGGLGRLAERAELLERVLTRTGDSSVQGEILGELSELWDSLVGDVDKAIHAYTRLIATDPDNADVVLPAARALERLHIQREDYPALADALEKQIAFEPDVETKKKLLGTLADLYESRLHNVDRAVACYVERLELDPSDLVAMLALERLYEQRSEHLKLIGILQKRDAVAQDEAEARRLARRIGDIYETRLDDKDSAIAAYNEVLSRFGNDRETLKALERVYEATERYPDLLEAIGHELELVSDPVERAEVRFRAAELMRKRTGALEAALDAYRVVLEDQPGHEPTIAALNEMVAAGGAMRIEAARVLVPHYEATRDHDRLIRTLEVVAEVDDVRERLAALRRAAEVAELGQDEPGRAFGLVARAVKAALGEHDLGQLLDDLDRMAHASLRWEAYGQLLREITPDIGDEDLALTVLMRAAAVARDKQEDRALAREYFDRALALRPEHHPALDALEQLHTQAADYRGLLAVLRKKAELAEEPIERTKLLMRQAELCAHKLDDVTAAIDAYERVLEEAPSHEVFDGLEALYARAERWVDLGGMYERQMDLNVGDPVLVRYKLAELLRTHLHDSERALELLSDVLDRSPTHEEATRSLESLMSEPTYRARAAELLEPVYLKKGRWPELTKSLEAQLEAEDDIERKKDLLGRLAQLHEVQLEDLDSALETYARLFRVEPSDTHAWESLARLSRLLGRQTRVAEVYEQYLDEVGLEDDVGVRLAVIAAQLRDGYGRDLEKAAALYQRALAFDPSARNVADALEDVLTRRRGFEELRTFYRGQADVAPDDTRRLYVLNRLARVLEAELADLPAAIQTYQEVLEVSPSDQAAIDALDRLLSDQQRFSDLAEHLGKQIESAVGSPKEVNLKLRLAKLFETQLDDLRQAIDTYEDVTRIDPSNVEARAALERLSARPELLRKVAEILSPLYESAGEWQKLVWLSERLAETEADEAERARLYGEVARLYEERGKEPRQALVAYRRALFTDPSDEHARDEIERLAGILGDWDTMVVAYEEACEVTNDNDIKAALLAAIARTHDERRGDPRAAITAYEKLVQLETDDVTPFEQLEALLTMVGDWRGLVALLKRKVERAYDAMERSELWRRAGSVLDELLGDAEGAIQAYRAALEETDDDTASLEALDGLYERTGDSRALADVLRRRAELSPSADERLDVNLRLGRVLAGPLQRPHEAIEAYTRVLDDDPSHAEAIRALGELYESQSLWSDLLDNLRRQLELATDGNERLALTGRIGVVLDERLNELDDAIEAYRDALAIDGSHAPSIRALMRIGEQADYRARTEEILEPTLRANQSWEDLATLLSRGLSSITDPIDRQVRLSRLAEVHEQGRGDKQAAFEALCQALLDDADDEGLVREVDRLAGELDAWPRAAEVFTRRASQTGDAYYARELYRRVAVIAEQRLQDLPRAVDANERALERGGDDDAVLADLERLYEATEQWTELGDILERRVSQISDDTLAASLLVRLGELRETRFDDKRGALAAYRDVLEREPLDPRAVIALERLVNEPALAEDVIDLLDGVYRQAGDLTRVAELYEAKLKLAQGQGERVSLLSDLAALWERDIGDFARAAEALKRAFETDPSDYGLLDEIERVATASGRFEVLEGLAETATRSDDVSRSDRRDLWMRAAGWYRDRLNATRRAEEALRKALEADPEYEPAYEQLTQLLRAEGQSAEVVTVLMTWADRETDSTMARERLREAASIAEHQAGDVDRAVQAYERILSSDSGAIDALDELIRIHGSAGRLGKVALLYDRRIEAEESPSDRVELRHHAAALRAGKLEETDSAIKLYLDNLEDEPSDLRSLAALERLYEQAERWDDLVRMLERRLDVATTADDRTAARIRLALVSEQRLGNASRAIDELREILADNPDHRDAAEALARLYESEGRFDDLVEHLEHRADRARDLSDPTIELATLVRLGEVIEQKLNDKARAAQIYERVLERDPGHVGALRALARLYIVAGEHERSADVLENLLARVQGEELVELSYQLATIAEDELKAHGRAEAALRRSLSTGLRTPETRERLAKLYERRGDFASLVDLVSEEVDLTKDVPQKVGLLRRLADLAKSKLGDARAAAQYLERASELVPEDRTVLVPLCELYIAAGQSNAAVPVLEKIIASYGGRRVKEVAGYHHMLARAYQGMGEADKALNELDAAYRVDLTNVGVLADLGMLAYERSDLDRAQKTFRQLLLQKLDKGAPITKADVYFYLGDIARQQGDAQKAISMLERAMAEQAGHPRAKALLATLKG